MARDLKVTWPSSLARAWLAFKYIEIEIGLFGLPKWVVQRIWVHIELINDNTYSFTQIIVLNLLLTPIVFIQRIQDVHRGSLICRHKKWAEQGKVSLLQKKSFVRRFEMDVGGGRQFKPPWLMPGINRGDHFLLAETVINNRLVKSINKVGTLKCPPRLIDINRGGCLNANASAGTL
jgi:hypothetical protein